MSDTTTTETHSTTADPCGLLVVTLDGAAVGRLAGSDLVVHETFERRVDRALPADPDNGREERERERAAFFRRVADAAGAHLLGDDPVPTIVVGGTVTDVDRLREVLDPTLDDRVVTTETIEYAGERGLRALRDAVTPDTDDPLDAFFDRLGGDDVVYGEDDVRDAIEEGTVETLFVASTFPDAKREELEERVEETVVVDADTERGETFASAFGGVGALLGN
jgi:peptide subunit release factor 1 (eRF1)